MTPQELIESGQLELYALQALPPEEMAEVEAMAVRHPQVKAALDEQFELLEKYAMLHATEPPAHLQARIENAISALPRQARVHQLTPDIEESQSTDNQVYMRPEHTNGNWWRYAFAACVALFLLSAGLNVLFYNRWQNTQSQLSGLVAQNQQLAQQYKVVNNEMQEHAQEIALIHNPQVFPVALNNMPNAPLARACVYWNKTSGVVYFDPGSLPKPPAGKQYQLWALDKGKPIDAGMVALQADESELGQMKNIKSAQAFAITIESLGGRPSPSLDQLKVMGQLPA